MRSAVFWGLIAVAGAAVHRRLGRCVPWIALTGVAGFAGFAAILAFIGGHPDWMLPLKAVALMLGSTALSAALPWRRLAWRAAPGSPLNKVFFFLLLVRHFAQIFEAESRRVMTSWRLEGGGLGALPHALKAVLRRAVERAERFYAAQLAGGAE